MFHSARITLTVWYLLIIMTVSIAFSIFIYAGAAREFDRILRVQRYHIEHPEQPGGMNAPVYFLERPANSLEVRVINDAKLRTLEGLISVNVFILLLSGFAGYFLAGQTLRPIKKMVDEQNQFITDASHELRTPLTALRTEVEVGLRDASLSLPNAKKLLESNLEEIISLQTLSDRLLELANEAGNQQLIEVSLSSIITSALKTVGSLAKAKHITIKNKIKNEKIQAIPEKVIELCVILLDNAIKYSPSKSTITITSIVKDASVLLSVKDEGYGIEKEDLTHLFDRFYRANKSRSKMDIPGYGLGLSIAKRIMDIHNGTIEIDSSINRGTIVTVRFHLA